MNNKRHDYFFSKINSSKLEKNNFVQLALVFVAT